MGQHIAYCLRVCCAYYHTPFPAMSNQVVLVDTHDAPVGVADKLEAHQEGWLHRAFSVFVFDANGRLLLQQRNSEKYHSGGLWSNTCCSHPFPEEPVAEAAQRRLREEMGFQCPLDPAFRFTYRAVLSDTMIEHEYDHVLIGQAAPTVVPNPDEVQDWTWVAPAALRQDVHAHPEQYTAWFKIVLDRVLEHAGTVYPDAHLLHENATEPPLSTATPIQVVQEERV